MSKGIESGDAAVLMWQVICGTERVLFPNEKDPGARIYQRNVWQLRNDGGVQVTHVENPEPSKRMVRVADKVGKLMKKFSRGRDGQ